MSALRSQHLPAKGDDNGQTYGGDSNGQHNVEGGLAEVSPQGKPFRLRQPVREIGFYSCSTFNLSFEAVETGVVYCHFCSFEEKFLCYVDRHIEIVLFMLVEDLGGGVA